MILILSLLGISWIKSKRINWKQLTILAVSFVFVFTSIAVALQKGYVNRDATLAENLPAIIESFQWYAVGGIVAFDQIFHDPQKIPHAWDIDRVFKQAANKLGARFYIPSMNAEFVDIGPEIDTNVYTCYFGYFPEFGLFGTTIIMMFLGAALTWVFKVAYRGDPRAQILYGFLLSCIVLSEFNETFFYGLNFLLKAIILCYVAYKWRRLEAIFRVTPRAVSNILPSTGGGGRAPRTA